MKVVVSFYPPDEAELMEKVDAALQSVLDSDAIRTEHTRRETPIHATVYITKMTADGISAVKELRQKIKEDRHNG